MLYFEVIEKHPADKVGFVFKGEETTFGEFRKKIDAWANFLQSKGVKKGDRVGLISRNSTDYVAAYLATIKAGGIIVPINFQLIAPEIAYIVNDTAMKLLITQKHMDNLEEALSYYGYNNIVEQLEFTDLHEAEDHEFEEVPMNEDEVCTIIYTSGTTGRPKGAMLSHKNLISNTLDITEFANYGDEEVAMCVLPMYHCFGWTCSVSANLLKGATMVIQDVFNFTDCIRLITKYKATVFAAVPPIFQLFLKAAPATVFSNMKTLVSGGASMAKTVDEAFKAKFGIQVQVGYGLSEAAPVVVGNPAGDKAKLGSIGVPMYRQTVKIMDDDMNEVPVGEVGELCVQGPNVMKGYWNRPQESKHALRGGWLHTEDLAYKDEDGYFFIVDRLKDLIIASGENIYPREVEEILIAHPDVADAAVIGVSDNLRGQIVCAYVVPEEGAVLDKSIMRKYLMGKVAQYKIPKEYIFTELLPRNSTGKVLKNVLRERTMEDLEAQKKK